MELGERGVCTEREREKREEKFVQCVGGGKLWDGKSPLHEIDMGLAFGSHF